MKNLYAIIVSEFNTEITDKLLDGAVSHFKENGIEEDNLRIIKVPGAVEIPLIAQILAKTKKFNAIVCLGCVIRGETSHYDYVCEQVSQGCQRVMLDHEVPVIFGILTTENEEQAFDRLDGKEGHKGKDAADAALKMTHILSSMSHLI